MDNISMNMLADLEEKEMHLLPFGTDYTGRAAVDNYFKIRTTG